MATAAMLLESWLDPPLQAFFGPGSINWHIAIVDPVAKTPLSIPAGGALTFTWTQPPTQNSPQVLPTVVDSPNTFHAVLPVTTAMFGKLIMLATLTDASSAIVDQNTIKVFIYNEGAG